MRLSAEALDLLRKMLAREVVEQVKGGRGDEPMSDAWTDLYFLTLEV